MALAARVSDLHTCPQVQPGPVPHVGGPILPRGCASVLIGLHPSARVGDLAMCVGPVDKITSGSPSVFIGYLPAARLGDPTQHGGVIVTGFGTVDIGGTAAQGDSSILAELSSFLVDLWQDIFGERYSDGIVIKGTTEYREKVREHLDTLKRTPTGRLLLERIDAQGRDGKGVVIYSVPPAENQCMPTGTWRDSRPVSAALDASTGKISVATPGNGTTSEVGFNPDYEPQYPGGESCRSPAIGLGHELIHAMHNGDGTNLGTYADSTDLGVPGGSNHEEAQTIGRGAYANDPITDNALRRDLGYKPRTSHGSVCP